MTDDTDRSPRPTAAQFFSVARRPRWIAALVLALAVASGFAALGQWQLQRSVENAAAPEIDTETPVPLETVAEPQRPMTDASIGQRVTVSGHLVAGDFVVLTGRENDGVQGAWLVGHLVTDDGASLAVGLGWAPDADAARAAEADVPTDQPFTVAGRYLPTESPEVNDVEAGEQRALSIGELLNLWAEPGPVFAGYVVLAEPTPGLDAIHQPPPFRDVSLNWLNVFYAAEWVIFAGFAVYLWYRVVRDVWEKEEEERTAAAP
ncbi:SURF1 family protein [Protaetiibacter intestinalis]|uniref:SURF1-like protein n=1 Tax=Protaetiibacter intestinalis TaxID=2419774 RepID=A0A387B516_9MICO|nr:SURF1 family protein [Protaetiibacter intestinalis]AYF97503.1 SURF1 family protein [Protaetiibacter intestinalis]